MKNKSSTLNMTPQDLAGWVGAVPTMAYTERPRPKGVPFSQATQRRFPPKCNENTF